MKFLMESQTLQMTLLVLVILGVLYALYMKYGKEGYTDMYTEEAAIAENLTKQKYESQRLPEEDLVGQEEGRGKILRDVARQDEMTTYPEDLMPRYSAEDSWAVANPETSGSVNQQNLLEPGYHTGIDTQTSTQKISTYDIRELPPVAKEQVSPWNNSTVLPDPHRRGLKQ